MAKRTLSTVIADGTGDAFEFPGGLAIIALRGTWGGATINIQVSDDGTNFVDFRAESGFTADGAAALSLPKCWLRTSTASSTTSTSVAVTISGDIVTNFS